MPKPNQSGRKRFFYNQNIKRDKSGDKYKNLINHVIILVKRLEKEGMTKWMANALNKVQVKIKNYGITFAQVTKSLDHKGLSSLAAQVKEHLVFVQKKGSNVTPKALKATVANISPFLEGSSATKAKAATKNITKATNDVQKPVAKKTPVKKAGLSTANVEKKPAAKKASENTTKATSDSKKVVEKKTPAPKKAAAKKTTPSA